LFLLTISGDTAIMMNEELKKNKKVRKKKTNKEKKGFKMVNL
jgi:hypothetical protein